MHNQPSVRIGISRCLLGDPVRFDGGHKRDPYVMEVLGKFFQWVSVCPGVEIGMGTPRESIQLVQLPDGTHLRGTRSQQDLTQQMKEYSAEKVDELKSEGLHGYIFKKDSPSCGVFRVRIYNDQGNVSTKGSGMFAAAFIGANPLIPVEEEGRLNDLAIRENFVDRVFCYYRWTQFLHKKPTPAKLVEFHSGHKLTLLSHSTEMYRTLGRIVAVAGKKQVYDEYAAIFMQALKLKATPLKHANCLYHLMGYLKKNISQEDKAELVDCIEKYRQQLVPLIVPVTLLLHHFRRHPQDWVMRQTYLNPYPAELMLRNHV
jgi:uncharacterized protein YbgA (DUF1722 family)/uncharacterized protein YbbK (DUF523 family)